MDSITRTIILSGTGLVAVIMAPIVLEPPVLDVVRIAGGMFLGFSFGLASARRWMISDAGASLNPPREPTLPMTPVQREEAVKVHREWVARVIAEQEKAASRQPAGNATCDGGWTDEVVAHRVLIALRLDEDGYPIQPASDAEPTSSNLGHG